MTAKTLSDLIGVQAGEYYALVSKIESNNNPLAKNPNSSASGLYQPIKSTWEGMGFKWSDRWTPAVQHQFIEKFTFANAKLLLAKGCAINFATLYGAHFLGASGLLALMYAKTGDEITTVTSAAQRKANPSILGEFIMHETVKGGARKRTVLDFCKWLEGKTGHSVYKNLVDRPVSQPVPDIPKSATQEGNAVMNWVNALVTKTTIQYALVWIGGVLVGRGIIDAGSWQEISAGLALIVPAVFGIKNAATEKVMVGGQVSKIASLTPATQNAIAREVGAK